MIDPAYAVQDLLDILAADGMRLTGVVATHYHADHVGGSLGGRTEIAGIVELLERIDVPIHVQADEVEWVTKRTGVGEGSLVAHDAGDVLSVGQFEVSLIHTPGHTPGSQCLLVDGRLISGDTLFLDGCGRTDLPGSDPAAMYESLHTRLARVPDDVILFPGHMYSSDPLGLHGRHPKVELCLPPALRPGVAGHVRRLTIFGGGEAGWMR